MKTKKTQRCNADVPGHTDPSTRIFPFRLDRALNFDSNKSRWYVGRWHRSCVAPSMFDSGDETVVMVVDGLRDGAPFLSPSLDILEVMYIKAELCWLGRCQNTFILICKTPHGSVGHGFRSSWQTAVGRENTTSVFYVCFIHSFIHPFKMIDRKIRIIFFVPWDPFWEFVWSWFSVIISSWGQFRSSLHLMFGSQEALQTSVLNWRVDGVKK